MWVLVLLHGCSNSGLGQPTGETADSAPPAGLEDCPWVGEWDLDALKCGGTFDYTAWYETHEGASMVIGHDPAGGCAVVTTIRGAECSREESWHLGVPVGTDVTWTSAGITECTPNKCRFLAEEPECKPGRGAGEAVVRIEDVGGSLTAVNLLRDTVPAASCGLDIYTVWTLK